MNNILRIGLLLAFFYVFSTCSREHENKQIYNQVPEQTADGWTTNSLESVNMNPEIIGTMMQYIVNGNHKIHSILIVKDGQLVFEEYFEGYLYSGNPPGSDGAYIMYTRETDHYLASVSKTVTSVIVGTAIKEGFVENIEDKVVHYLPDYDDILTGDKMDITLKHLLTMSSGLTWDENSYSYEDPRNNVVQLFLSDDPIEYILSLPLISSPGSEFLYNSGGTNVIGAIIQECAGMSLLEFGNTFLFDPLNIEGGVWQSLPGGYLFASGGLFLRPRELAKIGYLFLNNGYWGEHQIISEDWIEESVNEHIDTYGRTLPLAHAYGYQWWMQDFQVNGQTYASFLAAGWGEQYMYIFPEEAMIVLFNCGYYLTPVSISPYDLTRDYILNSLMN